MERDLKMFFLTLPFRLTLVSTTVLGFSLLSTPCPEKPARPGFGERLLTDELVETGSLSYHYADLCQILSCLLSSSFVLNVSVPSTWDFRALRLSTLSAPSCVSARELVAVLHT